MEYERERESRLDCGKDTVCDGCGFDGWPDVVDTEDVRSAEDGGYVGCGGGVEPGLRGRGGALDGGENWMLGESMAQEALARGPDEDGLVEGFELSKDVFRHEQDAIDSFFPGRRVQRYDILEYVRFTQRSR